MTQQKPVLVWLRRDFRLADHAAISAALTRGGPVIPVYVHDAIDATLGAAPRWRLGRAVAAFGDSLSDIDSRLIVRRGDALDTLRALVRETGAGAVYWSRAYDPASVARDTRVKAALKADGLDAESFQGALLAEPWTVQTQAGGPFRVFTPFWRATAPRHPGRPLPAPSRLPAPPRWPESLPVSALDFDGAMNRGAAVVARHAVVGEGAARARLEAFVGDGLSRYAAGRDRLGEDGSSGLSENLAWGEISPRMIHARVSLAAEAAGIDGAPYLRQLAWRDFAWHLLWHFPELDRTNWSPGWEGFPWRRDTDEAEAWRRGQTGEPLVDAAMRELHVTGRMHNRARMVAASYLTKHLLVDWRIGLRFFADHLIDWDPASNTMGWQWVAGCGPDASPFFRIFNPEAQRENFDPDGAYLNRFLGNGAEAQEFFDAVPRRWNLTAGGPAPGRIVELGFGRQRALEAYAAMKEGRG
jgi:deoxyribodipyrimidine photo-lyase